MYNLQINQNRSVFKRALKTPVTLILGIMMALTGILTIAFLASLKGDFSDLITSLSYSFRAFFPNYKSSSEELFEATTVIIIISAIVAPVLSFMGYLFTFIDSGSRSSKTPKGGTVVLMVSSIVSLLGFASILIMYLSSFETYTNALDSDYVSDDVISLFIRVTLLVVAYTLYGISNLIFNCSLSSMCSGTKRSGGGAVLFAISSIFVAFIYLLFIIDVTTEDDNLSDQGNLLIATLFFSAVSYILTAAFAFIFKSRINASVTPEYSAIPAAPVMEAPAYTGYANPYTQAPAPYPTYSPVADTQRVPVATNTEAVAVRTPVREAEEAFVNPTEKPADIPAFCAECGTPIKPDQVFCAVCGSKLK
ncbi:MAG: zinc ribbon domain-containing protein [Ruminococcaceae bacterium]|nr:zinc ribbon domain-containing protein [Oscillospiraceae bacterium]